MTPQEVARRVAARYARRVWWADRAELEQQASVAVLEARRTWRQDVGVPFDAYAWRAAVLSLRNYLWECSLPLTFPKRAANIRALAQGLVQLPFEDHEAPTPPADVELGEARWRARVREQIQALVGHDGDSSLAVAVLLDERMPHEVADSHGVPVERIYRATRRARELMRMDLTLYELWRDSER